MSYYQISEEERVLQILGFTCDDLSSEAEHARTWMLATLDEDEGWFEERTDEQIRVAYESWRRTV